MEPYHYLAGQPGKGVRERLVEAFNIWLKLEPEDLEKVQSIIQLLHNASLMIDDIEDNSKMRRGIPVCHAIYGIPTTINTANFVYFLAQQKCRELRGPDTIDIFIEEVLRLHRGQGLDIFWRDSNECPTEQEYLYMVVDKTGGLFRLAIRLAQSQSTVTTNFIPLVNAIGTYFQILDDYLNLRSPSYMKHKIPYEDLTEGKFSFPIIHAVRANPLDRRIMSILKQRTEDIDIKSHAVDYMAKLGSFKYTLEVLDLLFDQCIKEVANLGSNEKLEAIIRDLHKMSRINPDDQ